MFTEYTKEEDFGNSRVVANVCGTRANYTVQTILAFLSIITSGNNPAFYDRTHILSLHYNV